MFDGQECGFRAEAGGQAHTSRWTVDPDEMSLLRQEALQKSLLKGSGPTPEEQWAQEFAGFVRVYRRRFRKVSTQEQYRYELGGEDLAVFLPAQEGTAIELVVREVDGLLFELAQVREILSALESTQTLPLSGSVAWEGYEPLIAASNDAMARRLHPMLGAFYLKYEQLRALLGQLDLVLTGSSRSSVPAMITRLDILGTQAIWAFEDARDAESSRAARRDVHAGLAVSVAGRPEPALALTAVELRNIRCFEHLKLDLSSAAKPCDWVLVVGDNARGKSTLLRSIAMGLCNEADAAALLKKIPGRMLRGDAREGHIELTLGDQEGKSYTIGTDIKLEPDANVEILRRRTLPEGRFPWSRIFVCAYGTQRTRHAQQSYERYAALDAVLSLFDYDADLQNPEVILSRQSPAARARMEHKLQQILMLEGEHCGIDYSAGGIELSGPWGRLPLGSLSDGYRSTFQWVLDLIGWLIYAGRFEHDDDVAGLVLIDELEQHLHPRWQRYIISQIHHQFPGIQFIASTHTPLVAAGIADIDNAMLIKLEEDENGATTANPIDPRTLRGQRADQVLTSPAFGLVTSRSPGSTDDIARYTELAAKERTSEEEDEFNELTRRLEATLSFGETPFEQTVEQAVRKTLDDMLGKTPDKTTEFELKKQLRGLFRGGEPT
jgi:energy-coupling factor transporter ATP-binding protein EcfA2